MLQYDIYIKNGKEWILQSREVEHISTDFISYLINCGIKTDEIKIKIKELNI